MWRHLGPPLLLLACAAPPPAQADPPPVEVAAPAPAPETWGGQAQDYGWLAADVIYTPLWTRVPTPDGYARPPAEGYAAWLRALPARPAGSPVRTHRGAQVFAGDDPQLLAVLDLDVGDADLQQCADTVLRLRAEYLYQTQDPGLAFHYTSGDRSRWARWAEGVRPKVVGRQVSFAKTSAPDASRASFNAWLRDLFTYAGTLSLAREGALATGAVTGGDFLVQGGSPGHAVVVLDTAMDAQGRIVALIAEGFMPAMDAHLLAGPVAGWWPTDAPLQIPTWTSPFDWGQRRRF